MIVENTLVKSALKTVSLLTEERHWKLATLLALCFGARYFLPYSQRILLWDDFMHFYHGTTTEQFLKHWFSTYLHFIPLMKLIYFLLMQSFPLSYLPMVTSLWTFFLVCWFSFVFVRLVRFYEISHLAGLSALSFVLFNPMFSEVQMWFCSSFYLMGLVLAMEGVIQVEYAIRGDRNIRWAGALVFGVLAPCAWSMGYLVAIYYAVIFFLERKRVHSPVKALSILLCAFFVYPALRTLGELWLGHDYTGVKPWEFLPWIKAMNRIVGDGLILGSLGFWEKPANLIKHAGRFLNVLSLAMFLGVVCLIRSRRWKKLGVLAFFSIWLGYGVPFFFRGPQFSYEHLKWFLRYFATPLFGTALALAVFWHWLCEKQPKARLMCLIAMTLMVLISLGDKMPEHYVSAGSPRKKNFRPAQVIQLEFLERFFEKARALGIHSNDLSDHYYLPIVGERTFNGMNLYGGSNAPEPLHEKAVRILDKEFASPLWESYLPFGFVPELSANQLGRKYEKPTRASILPLVARGGLLPLVSISGEKFRVMNQDPFLVYELNPARNLSLLSWKIDTSSSLKLRFTFEFTEPQMHDRFVIVRCPPCSFTLPMERLPWIPQLPVSRVVLKFENMVLNEEFQISEASAQAQLNGI